MAQEDYPYCIFCDNKVAQLTVSNGAIVYLCNHCGETATTVRDND